jgi:hypothetical protein
MPKTLTFADHLSFELLAYNDKVDDEHNSNYDPNADSDTYSTSDDLNDSDASFGPEDNNPNDHGLNDNIVLCTTECWQPTGVELTHDNHNNNDESNGNDDSSNDDNDNEDQNTNSKDDNDDEDRNDEVEVADQTSGFQENDTPNDGVVTPDKARKDAPNATELEDHLEVPAEIAGAETDDQIAGVETDYQITREMGEKYSPQNHNNNLRPWKLCSYNHLHAYPEGKHSGEILLANIDYNCSLEVLFLTEQMLLMRGLKAFGKAGTDAVVKEMGQLNQMKTIIPRAVNKLS